MFQNAKPIFTQTITTLKDMNLCDAMDLSHEFLESKIAKAEQCSDYQKINSRQTVLLNHDIASCNDVNINQNERDKQNSQIDKNSNKCIFENNDMEIDNGQEENIEMQQKLIEKTARQKERQTMYDEDVAYNMSIEKSAIVEGKISTEIKENTELEKDIFEDNSRKHTRKTLFLDEEILFENPLTETEKNKEMEYPAKSFSNRNTTRKTLYFNNEIPLEESQFINEKDKSIEKAGTKIENITRKTMIFNNEIPLEEFHEKNNQSIEIENCKPTRKTLYFNNEIAIEDGPENIENNAQNCNAKRKIMRKTMIFNNEIPLEDIEKNNRGVKPSEDIENCSPTSKTLCFNNEIEVENVPEKIENNIQSGKEKFKTVRKTLHFNNEIDIEKGEISEIEDVNQSDIQNFNPNSKMLHFNNDIPAEKAPIEIGDQSQNFNPINNENAMQNDESNVSPENLEPPRQSRCELEESKGVNIANKLFKQVPQTRKSVYQAQEMDVTLNETTTARVENNEPVPAIDVSNNRINVDNKLHSNTLSVPKSRKSIYTEEGMDLTLNVSEFEKEEKVIENACQSKILSNDSMKTSKENRKTLIFDGNNEMSIDESFTPMNNDKISETEQPINAAKLRLSRHITTNAFTNKSKLMNKDENTLITPKKFTGTNFNNPWFYTATPNQSLLDFTKDEKIFIEEERRTENSNKRLPVNITPVLSIPKKRHTFDDCQMDISCNEKLIQAEESKNLEPFRLSKGVISDHVMEISGIVANNSILETPTKQRKSRIPIPISSGKKSNRSFSLLQSTDVQPKEDDDHLNMEVDDQLNMDGDTLAESIQVMRRATTFLHRRDTEIGVKELDVETEADHVKKTSIFEGNPITISDVTVFFEAQRKSNSVVPETEMTLGVDKMNMSSFNDIERAKKSLENRYLNLSLEDIDKTRLSLVQVSYEDGTINNTNASAQEQMDDCVENPEVPVDKNISNSGPENNIDRKNRRHSVNYLRNASTICRKCKRCQDTFLNETSSSTSESFMLPPLPPLPDLGLERLRRLRKRPAIADVNVLWQRVSLDRTIINALNISDDDSQIISDLDEQVDDELSPAIKCIRKYEKEMLR